MKIKASFVFSLMLLTCFGPLNAYEPGTDLATRSAVQEIAWDDHANKGSVIYLSASTSQILRFDRRIIRAAVSDVNVCDITTVGTSDVLVFAKKPGNANLIVWDNDNNIATFGLQAMPDMYKLEKILKGIDANAEIKILPFNETVSVYGTTETSGTLKQMQDAIKGFNDKALSHVKIKEPKQILLEVRFAEVDRTRAKEFKLDVEAITRFNIWSSFTGKTGQSLTDRESTYSARNSIFSAEIMPIATETTANLSIPYIGRTIAIFPYLKYLEDNNILKIIARPNLVTKDGEEAEFSVGGEFPIPVSSGDGDVTIQYKEFGTKMVFKPEMLDNEVIRLNITAEVSELDFSTTVSSGGVEVPALNKREEKTVSEMKDKQTLVIGGLISQKITKTHRKTPGLGDIPILKVLFNADTYDYTEIELLIVVTPHIVKPFDTGENKEFFNVENVKTGISAMEFASADPQANAIGNIFVQNEKLLPRKLEEEKKTLKKFKSAEKGAAWQASLPVNESWSSGTSSPETVAATSSGVQNGGILPGGATAAAPLNP